MSSRPPSVLLPTDPGGVSKRNDEGHLDSNKTLFFNFLFQLTFLRVTTSGEGGRPRPSAFLPGHTTPSSAHGPPGRVKVGVLTTIKSTTTKVLVSKELIFYSVTLSRESERSRYSNVKIYYLGPVTRGL